MGNIGSFYEFLRSSRCNDECGVPCSSVLDAGVAICSRWLRFCSDLDLVSLQAGVKRTMESRNLESCRVQKSNCFTMPSSEMEFLKGFEQASTHKTLQLDSVSSGRQQVRVWHSRTSPESSASKRALGQLWRKQINQLRKTRRERLHMLLLVFQK